MKQPGNSCTEIVFAHGMQIRVESFESLTSALSSPVAAYSVAANLDRLVALFVENIGMILSVSAHISKEVLTDLMPLMP